MTRYDVWKSGGSLAGRTEHDPEEVTGEIERFGRFRKGAQAYEDGGTEQLLIEYADGRTRYNVPFEALETHLGDDSREVSRAELRFQYDTGEEAFFAINYGESTFHIRPHHAEISGTKALRDTISRESGITCYRSPVTVIRSGLDSAFDHLKELYADRQ